ncbi:MAG: phage holin family protein, partial [Candidatus Riflebacteria bacterium]|nr:phage holin family protein [Candidatus Riflebacteria bacterium]
MGLVLQLLVSSIVMLILSKLIPGFEIKDFKTSVLVALIFGILMVFSGLLVSPLSWLATSIASLVSGIPLIGTIAGIGSKILLFLINFIVGSIMLCITDKFLTGFKMRSFAVGI